jgi:hypothetical protein
VGDDATHGTRLARAVIANQLALILTSQDAAAAVEAIGNSSDFLTEATRPVIASLVTSLSQAGRDHNVPTKPGAQDIPEVRTLSELLAVLILAELVYDELRVGPPFVNGWKGSNEQVYDALDGAMGTLRETAIRYFDAKGGTPPLELAFERFVQLGAPTNLCKYPERVKLQRPVDACTYLVDDLLSRTQGKLLSNSQAVFAALAVQPTAGVKDLTQLQPGDPEYYLDPGDHQVRAASQRLNAAINSLLGSFALALSRPGSVVLPDLVEALGTYADAHTFTSPPSPRPALGLGTPCVPTPTPAPTSAP